MSILLKRLLSFALGFGSLVIAAQADSNVPTDSHCCHCYCKNTYFGASAIWAGSKKFSGGGGMAHLGYTFSRSDYGAMALEFETGYLRETGNASNGTAFETFYKKDTNGDPIPGTGTDMRMTQCRDGKIEMVPLMLNVIYNVKLSKWVYWSDAILLTVGAGVGANILKTEDSSTTRYYDSFDKLAHTAPENCSHTRGKWAGQLFTRIGFNITDNIQVYTGARAFFTPEVTMGSNTITEFETEVAHVFIDLGLNMNW